MALLSAPELLARCRVSIARDLDAHLKATAYAFVLDGMRFAGLQSSHRPPCRSTECSPGLHRTLDVEPALMEVDVLACSLVWPPLEVPCKSPDEVLVPEALQKSLVHSQEEPSLEEFLSVPPELLGYELLTLLIPSVEPNPAKPLELEQLPSVLLVLGSELQCSPIVGHNPSMSANENRFFLPEVRSDSPPSEDSSLWCTSTLTDPSGVWPVALLEDPCISLA